MTAWLATRRATALAVALGMALGATSIAVGFLTDDHAFRALLHSTRAGAPAPWDLFRFVSGDPDGNALRVRHGLSPWWAAPDLEIHFLRPLTSLAFALDDRLFGAHPLGYHLTTLAWLGALLAGAAALFRRTLPPVAATLATAIFAFAAAHVEAWAWISARHVLIAGAFAAWALARRGWPGALLLALGLAGSEAALAAVPIWCALERGRPRACAAPVALGLGYLLLYAGLGFGTRASGGYHDPVADPLGFVALAALRVPILLGDAAAGIPAELAHVVAEWKLALAGLVACALVALARPPKEVAWLAAGGVAATLLGAAGTPAGRVLLIPDLALAAVLGATIARAPTRPLALLLAVLHLVVAPLASLRAVGKLVHRAAATRAVAGELAALAPPSGRVFLVAASDPLVFLYPRGILADTSPGTVRCWSVLSAARAAHRVTRVDAHTLVVEPEGRALLDRSFDVLFRDRGFASGDRVEQCGATIRVAAVDDRGHPTRLEISMRRVLDDPELAWSVWRDGHLQRFVLPAPGQTVELPWSPGPTGAL